MHSTNYTNTFIEIAEDCPADKGEIPPVKGRTLTAANIQYNMLKKNPYKYTSDDVLFQVFADKQDLTFGEYEKARAAFFSKGQPCLRASPLTKRYGWGIHSNADGRIAMVGCETAEYERLIKDQKIKVIKAMKSNR